MSDFIASFALLMHNKIRIFEKINKQKVSQLSILYCWSNYINCKQILNRVALDHSAITLLNLLVDLSFLQKYFLFIEGFSLHVSTWNGRAVETL